MIHRLYNRIRSRIKIRMMIPAGMLLLLLVLPGIYGCDQQTDPQTAIIPEEEMIAVVNNKKIPLSKFQKRLHLFLQHYRELIATNEEQMKAIKNIVIQRLIEEELISQEASRKGIQVPDEELESMIAESLSSFERTNFDIYLRRGNLSEEEWKERLKHYLVLRKLVDAEVIDKIPITKREIKSYYNENRSKFITPQAIKVRNITLSTEEEAEAIHSQLERGRDFKELVKQHSISPDKILDGDLGYIVKGDLPVEMDAEIFDRKFNRFRPRLTDVVRSQDGYHIFLLERYRSRGILSLDEARNQIKQILLEQKWDEYYRKWLDRIKANATISIDEEMLSREEGF